MPFARQLRDLLRVRERLVPAEFAKGEPLESVLERHLLVVESTADFDTVTSILLLDGNTLHHGAGPKLAKSYRDAINGLPIGPDTQDWLKMLVGFDVMFTAVSLILVETVLVG